MLWSKFEALKEDYRKTWGTMRNDSPAKIAKFLKKSFLAVDYGLGQMELENALPLAIVANNEDFFVTDSNSKTFISLVGDLKRIKDKGKNTTDLDRQLKEFDVSSLKVREFQVEIRFPSCNMLLIREIKKSQYVDQNLSCQCDACLKVVLKRDFI